MATTLTMRAIAPGGAAAPGELVIDPEIIARFYEHVNKLPGDDACWIWTGGVTPGTGTPRFNCQATQFDAARVAWEIEGRGSTDGIRLVNDRGCDQMCIAPHHRREAGPLPGRPPKGVFPVKRDGETPPMPHGVRLAPPRATPTRVETPRVRAESARLPVPTVLEPPAPLSDTDVVNVLDRSITTIVRGPNYVIVYGREETGMGADLRSAAASLAAKEARRVG